MKIGKYILLLLCLQPWLFAGAKQLIFKTKDVAARPITLIPYYEIDKQRYVLYWNLK